MNVVAVGLAGSAFLLVAAAMLLVAALLLISARRRPRTTPLIRFATADRHPEQDSRDAAGVAAIPLAVIIAQSNARLISERDEARRRLADVRMAHRAQQARLQHASALIGRAISEAPRESGSGEAEVRHLRTALSDAEGHLLAAEAAGRAGPSPASPVLSESNGAGGGTVTFPDRMGRTMALSPDRNPPSRVPPLRSGQP